METIILIIITMGALVTAGLLFGKAVDTSHGGCACGLQPCAYERDCSQSHPNQHPDD